MQPAGLVRAVEAEGRDGNVELAAGGRVDHVVAATHDTRCGGEGGARGVLEGFARADQRGFADDPFAMDVLGAAGGVGDGPGAFEELHRDAPVFSMRTR